MMNIATLLVLTFRLEFKVIFKSGQQCSMCCKVMASSAQGCYQNCFTHIVKGCHGERCSYEFACGCSSSSSSRSGTLAVLWLMRCQAIFVRGSFGVELNYQSYLLCVLNKSLCSGNFLASYHAAFLDYVCYVGRSQ